MRLLCAWALGFFLLPSMALANMDQDLNTFFQGVGFQSNVTGPSAYQSQAAGYYSGGSLFLRNQVKNYQLATIELPSFSAGCAGIDAFLGSFSIINADALKAFGKNILSAGGAYAFDLALTTTVPQIKSVKDFLQKYISDINAANVSSCNTAEDLVGGAWPKTQAAQQQICKDIGSHYGAFSDWAAASQGCGTGGEFKQTVGDGANRKSEILQNKNLVWDALQQSHFLSGDPSFAEALMSLSGTLIFRDGPGDAVLKTELPALGDSANTIKALLRGGSMPIYRCDEYGKCLNPTLGSTTISESKGMVTQVRQILADLVDQVRLDTGEIDTKTRGFLEKIQLPILRQIIAQLELRRSPNFSGQAEAIALSLLGQYFDENRLLIRQALGQQDTPATPELVQGLDRVNDEINRKIAQASSSTAMGVLGAQAAEAKITAKIAAKIQKEQ